MKKHIYDVFADRWYRNNGNVWIISDPHFSDDEMKYLRHNYISDEEQVKRINSKVGKNDTIIFLGDIGNIEFIKKIRGYKVLIMGNHDSGASNYIRRTTKEYTNTDEAQNLAEDIFSSSGDYKEKVVKLIGELSKIDSLDKIFTEKEVDNHLFDEVYEGPLVISEKVILSHEPIDLPYLFDIHGHTHDINRKNDSNHFCVCAEHIDYTPVSLKSILESGVLKNIDSIHRITIDTATERKRKKISIKG